MATFIRRKKTKIIIFAGCDACGQVHSVAFENALDFVRLMCPVEQAPLHGTLRAARLVFKEVQRDLLRVA